MSLMTTIEELSSTRRKFKIDVPAPSVKQAFTSAVSEIQSTAELKGFRKGKVPSTLVRKFFMSDIVKKAADRLVQESYNEATKNIDFQIVSFPHIEPESQFEEDKNFLFSATVDINPKFDVQGYKDVALKLPAKCAAPIEQELEDWLHDCARRFGKVEAASPGSSVQAHDIVTATLASENADLDLSLLFPVVSEEGKYRIDLGYSPFKELNEALLGMKQGDHKKVTFTIPTTFYKPEWQGKSVTLAVTISALETVTKEEINDALTQRMGFKNLDDAKRLMRENIEKSLVTLKVNSSFPQIVDQLLEKNQFDVPESLVDSTIDRTIAEYNEQVEKGQRVDTKDASVRHQYRESSEKHVKGILAFGHIARQEGISASDEELIQEMANFAMSNHIDPQQLLKAGRQIYDEFRGQVLVRKVVLKILESAKVEYT